MWVSDEILAGWPLISQARWLAIAGGPGIRIRSIAANHPEFLLPKSVLARTLVITVAALAVGTASATVKNDVAAADALTTAVTKGLEPSLFCEGVDQAKLKEWSDEFRLLIPIVHDWAERKRKNPKWAAPTSDAIDGLRVAKAKLAAARIDFDACLDWREVSGEWKAAAMSGASTAGPSVARLAKANLPRTKSAAYTLPRYGPTAAGTCATVLTEYLEGTSGAFAAGPVVDGAVELDVLSTLQQCGGVNDGTADERMALIRTDADLSGAVAGSADPGVIADSLKAALDAYPADVEKGRYTLIQSAVVKLRLAAEATTKARTAVAPSRGSVMVLDEISSKIAAVPLPEVARIAAGVKRSADALDVVVTKAEAAAEAAAAKAEVARQRAEAAAEAAAAREEVSRQKAEAAEKEFLKDFVQGHREGSERWWFGGLFGRTDEGLSTAVSREVWGVSITWSITFLQDWCAGNWQATVAVGGKTLARQVRRSFCESEAEGLPDGVYDPHWETGISARFPGFFTVEGCEKVLRRFCD